MNAETLFLSIGVCQLLESYCQASLESQFSTHFPIQVWDQVDSAKAEIEELANGWKWKTTFLKFSEIGAPKYLIDSVLKHSSYTPILSLGALRKYKDKINNFEELVNSYDNGELALYHEKLVALELGGSMAVTNANVLTLEKIQEKLTCLAKDLIDKWNRRQTKTKLQEAAQNAFAIIHDTNDPSNIAKMLELLETVILSLPGNQAESFVAKDCHPGFLSWNEYWKSSHSKDPEKLPPLTKVHLYYENWSKTSISENCLKFQELWELIMVRSTSEAKCETVGSMMVQHTGKHRHLEPENFSKEMFLRVNLGPMHLWDGLINEVLAYDSSKTYVRKESKIRRLVCSKDLNKSAAIANYETESEMKSTFPISFWDLSSNTK